MRNLLTVGLVLRSGLILSSALVACSPEPLETNEVGDSSSEMKTALGKAEPTQKARPAKLKNASFFVATPADRDETALDLVRQNTSKGIDFAGHFSHAVVPCGTGCEVHSLVDRRTGGVVGLPVTKGWEDHSQIIWDVSGSKSSDVITITYGPGTGIAEDSLCEEGQFRISGTAITGAGELHQVKCP